MVVPGEGGGALGPGVLGVVSGLGGEGGLEPIVSSTLIIYLYVLGCYLERVLLGGDHVD